MSRVSSSRSAVTWAMSWPTGSDKSGASALTACGERRADADGDSTSRAAAGEVGKVGDRGVRGGIPAESVAAAPRGRNDEQVARPDLGRRDRLGADRPLVAQRNEAGACRLGSAGLGSFDVARASRARLGIHCAVPARAAGCSSGRGHAGRRGQPAAGRAERQFNSLVCAGGTSSVLRRHCCGSSPRACRRATRSRPLARRRRCHAGTGPRGHRDAGRARCATSVQRDR